MTFLFYWRQLIVMLRNECYSDIMEIGEFRKYFPEVNKIFLRAA